MADLDRYARQAEELKGYDKYLKAFAVWHRKRIEKVKKDLKEYEETIQEYEKKYLKARTKLLTELEEEQEFLEAVVNVENKNYGHYKAFLKIFIHLIDTAPTDFLITLKKIKTPNTEKLFRELQTYPDYEEFKYLNEMQMPKLDLAIKLQEQDLLESLRKTEKYKRYVKRFELDNKEITLVIAYHPSIYHKLAILKKKVEESQNFKEKKEAELDLTNAEYFLSFLSDISEWLIEYIQHILPSFSKIITTPSCTLTYLFNENTVDKRNFLAAFSPFISTINEKFFYLSVIHFMRFANNESRNSIGEAIIHELTHAFDDKIESEIKTLMRQFWEAAINNSKPLSQNLVISGFLAHARTEGFAKLSELNSSRQALYYFCYPQYLFLEMNKIFLEQLTNLSTYEYPTQATSAHFWGSTIYGLGLWMFFTIQAYLLDLDSRLDKYFFFRMQEINDLIKKWEKKTAFNEEDLYKIEKQEELFKDTNVKITRVKELQKLLRAETKDRPAILKISKSDYNYVFPILRKLSAIDFYLTYQKACDHFNLKDQFRIFGKEFDQVMQIKEDQLRIERERAGFRMEKFRGAGKLSISSILKKVF